MSLSYSFTIIRKQLRFGYVSAAGRSFFGKICTRHQGGANKCKRYYIDFFRRQMHLAILAKSKNLHFLQVI